MIPFDLERAKKGVPIYTRSGISAKFIAHLDGSQPAPLIVEVMQRQVNRKGRLISDSTMIENYYEDGRHNPIHDSPLDLFMQY